MKYFILLVIGNEACGTCTADDYPSVEKAVEAFTDIKKNGRDSAFLTTIKDDNNAGIDFSDKSPIDVFISVEDEESFPVDEHHFYTQLSAAQCDNTIHI